MSSTTNIQGLHHITIVCANAQRTVDFYTRVLGLRFVKKTWDKDDLRKDMGDAMKVTLAKAGSVPVKARGLVGLPVKRLTMTPAGVLMSAGPWMCAAVALSMPATSIR